ncbi:MAG: hypothetical protein J6U50_09235 [Lachnospiraceae bacterium]|nr:hypothetical protein [Lachnospiraceae bacterium]
MNTRYYVGMGIFILIPVVLIFLGAVLWPKTSEEIVKAYDMLPGYKKMHTQTHSIIYFIASLSVALNHVMFRKKREREEAARQQKIADNKSARSWKCLTCGKVNLGVQEMCACGQKRDDVTNDRDFS